MNNTDAPNPINRLQDWYASNCDGDWEHQNGLSLQTLDNPGWTITIDLTDTDQENQGFEDQKIDYDDPHLWLFVRKEGSKLRGDCGPNKLERMLIIITDWLQPRS